MKKPVLNKNIAIISSERKKHSKASEEYIHVEFTYPSEKWNGWVPVEYRRTGLLIKTESELFAHLNFVYEQMRPENYKLWLEKQEKFWSEEKRNATTTKEFFDRLAAKSGWLCVDCDLPKNPNWARRIQDLKEFGYTLATNTKHYCENCNSNKTHLILLRIERGGNNGNAYEVWSPRLRKRIIQALGSIDVYENSSSAHCLPDHKFPEIRWDVTTKAENPDDMTDDQIRDKFQLLTNQRNQHKREVCRTCFQTSDRGSIYGIPYYYQGTSKWDPTIPTKGKRAEKGCVGCPWYDIELWRQHLVAKLND